MKKSSQACSLTPANTENTWAQHFSTLRWWARERRRENETPHHHNHKNEEGIHSFTTHVKQNYFKGTGFNLNFSFSAEELEHKNERIERESSRREKTHSLRGFGRSVGIKIKRIIFYSRRKRDKNIISISIYFVDVDLHVVFILFLEWIEGSFNCFIILSINIRSLILQLKSLVLMRFFVRFTYHVSSISDLCY